ncbi:MAG: ATP cone domain-containing protein [Roseburia sp.]
MKQYDRSKIEAGVLAHAIRDRFLRIRSISLSMKLKQQRSLTEGKEISSALIGEIVMDKIKNLDSVAYVRFASVYREFKDVNTFMSELKKMLDK